MKPVRILQYIGDIFLFLNLATFYFFYCLWWLFIGEEPVIDKIEFYEFIGTNIMFTTFLFLYIRFQFGNLIYRMIKLFIVFIGLAIMLPFSVIGVSTLPFNLFSINFYLIIARIVSLVGLIGLLIFTIIQCKFIIKKIRLKK